MAKSRPSRIVVENVIRPGKVRTVDAALYEAMKRAYLKILPRAEPGLTPVEAHARVIPHLPKTLFPGGARSGWWSKLVQLDLEAKGIISRAKSRPVRLYRT